MPQNCCRTDYDALFDESTARRELAAYRHKGVGGATRRLVDALRAQGVEGATLLDIGGGIGAIQHELLDAGATGSLAVEASHAYLAAARLEAEARGFGDRAEHRYGDFVDLAPEVAPADIVTLDRVICCYGDMPALVSASVQRARRLYGLVYPVDRWWLRLGIRIPNAFLALARRSFRGHIHPTRSVDALVRSHGLQPLLHHRGLIWQVALYSR
ncbi:MAG: SAM-dependent methyltransferase [Candidatus Limnocylindria bacterium]